jgi:hypothetical protein
VAWVHAATIVGREERQLERDPDNRRDSALPFGYFTERRCGFAVRAKPFNQSLRNFKTTAADSGQASYSAHALMENRNTILIDFQVEPADGYAERRGSCYD